MKSLIIALMFSLISAGAGYCDNVYRANGELIDKRADVNIWPVQFKNKADAQAIASGLENGQVFQDQDTHLYQVFYGNVEITGVIVIGSITEK